MAERGQLLAELIVHLAGDAPAFVFLGEHQPGEQFRARTVGALALADFGAERLVGARELRGAFADPDFELFVRTAQQLLGLFALGQIEMGADDAHHRSARLAPNRKAAREHVDVAAVLVPQPKLRLVGRLAAGHAVVRLVGARPIVRMHQTLPRADVRFDFVLGIAEHLLPARRIHDRVGLDVPIPDAFPGAGKRQRQPLLAFAQRLLGPFAFGDVEMGADDAHDRSARVPADRKTAREHVDVVTVLVPESELPFVGLAALRQALAQLVGAGLVVGMQQTLPGADVRFDFVLGVAEHLLPSRRVHDRAGLEVPVPHAFLSAGKRQREPLFVLTEDRPRRACAPRCRARSPGWLRPPGSSSRVELTSTSVTTPSSRTIFSSAGGTDWPAIIRPMRSRMSAWLSG